MQFLLFPCITLAVIANAFRITPGNRVFHKYSTSTTFTSLMATSTAPSATMQADSSNKDSSKGPSFYTDIRPSTTDRARTITHICSGGTLCTTSVMDGVQGFPFGSYVDYILDENGWPILLLSEQSLHTQNIQSNGAVSLFVQLPRSFSNPSTTGSTSSSASASTSSSSSRNSQQTAVAALSRVTVMGHIDSVPADNLNALKLAFTLIHPYAEQIVDSNKFKFVCIKPEKIYFSGGFGVQATWVDIAAYEAAKPDVLAQDVPNVLSRVNVDRQGELLLMAKHLLQVPEETTQFVRIQAIDRLGIDLRVKAGDFTDEYRIGFRHPVNSAEDAKSELMKLFQEVWERDQGHYFTNDLPPIKKYAEDILRNSKK